MDSVATLRERLLLLAQVRLKNRPLELEALRHEFSDDARLRGWPTLEKKLLALSLSTKTVARALRGPDGNDQNLVALIDDWLASRTATEPRALPPGDHSPTSDAAQSAPANPASLAPVDYVATLFVPNQETTWRGDEVPKLTAQALCPVPASPPLHVSALLRVDSDGGQDSALLRVESEDGQEPLPSLSDTDRASLDSHWQQCGLPPIAGPLTAEEWEPYLVAFNEAPARPDWADWLFAVRPPKDPHRDKRMSQTLVEIEHTKLLERALRDGAIVARARGAMTKAYPLARLQNVVLTRSELAKFCDMLCIEVKTTPDRDSDLRGEAASPKQWPESPELVVRNVGRIDEPPPLATSDIASCFGGLGWSQSRWKKPLGDKPKWLLACVAIAGVRGVSETKWNPVRIGGALVQRKSVKPNSVRARFQTQPKLIPWLEAWKSYEADYLDIE